MTEPHTKTGQRLVADGAYPWRLREDVLAIEAEAVARVRNEMALVEPDDDRIDYVTIQLTRSTWNEIR